MRVIGIILSIVLSISSVSGMVTVSTDKPDPTRELLRTALNYYNQGQYYEAVGFYEKALEIDSTLSEAHYYIADCYQYLYQYERAFEHYQRVDLIDQSEYPLLKMNLGLVQKSLGKYDQAEKYFLEFVNQTNSQLEN